MIRVVMLVAALAIVGCSKFVDVPIPEHCVASRWESERQTCREAATGRFALPECCGLKERAICSWIPCVE